MHNKDIERLPVCYYRLSLFHDFYFSDLVSACHMNA